MIYVNDLSELELENIIDLILEEKNQTIEFSIPKETQEFFSEKSAIAVDYLYAAYTGQKLKEASTKFEYDIVSTVDSGDFVFTVRFSDINFLAQTLLDISYGYVNDHPDPAFIFPEEVEGFLEKIENGTEAACPEFLEIYEEYNVEAEKEEIE